MHDGCGLCSPGRFHPAQRKSYDWKGLPLLIKGLDSLLSLLLGDVKAAVFKLTANQFKESPFSEELVSRARHFWLGLFAGDDSSYQELSVVATHQPFLLRAVCCMLKRIGDPDHRIFQGAKDSFTIGVPVGMLGLPRTPAVYERKLK